MRNLIALVLIVLFPSLALADLDRAIEAYNADDLASAKQEALAALDDGLSDEDRLLALELVMLSDYYAGREDLGFLQELRDFEVEVAAHYGQNALERVEFLSAISDLQYRLGRLKESTVTDALVIRIAENFPEAEEDFLTALHNIAVTYSGTDETEKSLLYASLFDFHASDRKAADHPRAMEAAAIKALALFYDGQMTRAAERFLNYTIEDWEAFASLGQYEADLAIELDEVMASIQIDDQDAFFAEVNAVHEKIWALDELFNEAMSEEAKRLEISARLTQLQQSGDTEAFEDALRGMDQSNFFIGDATIVKMDAYMQKAYADDPVVFVFANMILRNHLRSGEISRARPYLSMIASTPAEYLAATSIPIAELAAAEAQQGALEDTLVSALVVKAIEVDSIVPESDRSVVFDLVRAAARSKEVAGDFETALEFYKKAAVLGENLQNDAVTHMLSEATAAAVSSGRLVQARELADQFYSSAASREDEAGIISAIGQLAMIEAQAGNRDKALELSEQRLQLVQAQKPSVPEDIWLAKANALVVRMLLGESLTGDAKETLIDVLDGSELYGAAIGKELLETVALKLELEPGDYPGNTFFAELTNSQKPQVLAFLSEMAIARDDFEEAAEWSKIGFSVAVQPSDAYMRLKQAEGRLALANDDAVAGLKSFREISDVRLQPAVRSREGALAHLPYHISAAAILADDPVMGQDFRFHKEMFMMMQLFGSNSSGSALNAAFVRETAGTDIGGLLKERQEIESDLQSLDAAISRSKYFGEQPSSIIERATVMRERYTEISRDLADQAPELSAMIASNPVRMTTIAEQLQQDEVLITYVTSDLTHPRTGQAASFAFALSREHVLFVPIASRAELLAASSALRCSAALTDPSCSAAQGQGTRGTFGTFAGVAQSNQGPTFDGAPAYQAYQELVAPLEDILEGKSRIIVVPDRALAAMPFHLMLESPMLPGQAINESKWLIRDYSIEVVPSVLSFYFIRNQNEKSSGSQSFLGIGDPLIGEQRDGPITFDCGPEADEGILFADASSAIARSAGTNRTTNVAELLALPDSRCELKSVAAGFPDHKILLQDMATETGIKAMSASGELRNYSVISFATHGLVAGEIGVNDAALVLTPPAVATAKDDGLLSSAEIAGLELNAELVILSACNTASGDSEEDEGLSGLASAFFAAGAKSLVVSHWPVYSDAAVKLTTNTLTMLRTKPETTRADALRLAMLSVIDDPDATARELHPSYWGPFMLAGDGRGL
ncbi:MAG: CHAT domain-containing protein [Pseudomonadota bacterium]